MQGCGVLTFCASQGHKSPLLVPALSDSRWVDVAPWSVHGGGRKVSHKSQLEAARTTVPLALRKEYPDLPCVVVSGLPFSMSKEQFW